MTKKNCLERDDDEDDRDGARVDCNHARTRTRSDFYLYV